MNNKRSLSTFGKFPDLFKEALSLDIKNISKALRRKSIVVIPPDSVYEWELDDNEKIHLKLLLSELKDIANEVYVSEWNPSTYSFSQTESYKKRKKKSGIFYADTHIYRDLIRSFAKETMSLLTARGIQVELYYEDEHLIIETN